jgi:hypothetical protein
MHKEPSFLIKGAILIAAVVRVALYIMNIPNTLSTNMTMNTGPNMNKTMNTTAGWGNVRKSTHHETTEITRGIIGTSLELTCVA